GQVGRWGWIEKPRNTRKTRKARPEGRFELCAVKEAKQSVLPIGGCWRESAQPNFLPDSAQGEQKAGSIRAFGLIRGFPLQDQHGVAVAEETIFAGDGLRIDFLEPGDAVGRSG